MAVASAGPDSGDGQQASFGLVPERPLVSVLIRTCQKSAHWLPSAIASVVNQTYSPIEVVVVEDGSSIAEKCVGSFAGADGIRIVYRSIAKSGRSVAGNTALEIASGDLIQFLDDDDELFLDHIETLVAELACQSRWVAAYSLALEVPTIAASKEGQAHKELRPYVAYRSRFSREALSRRNFLPIQSVLFRRELFLQLGGFQQSLDALEDWDLWKRYATAGEFCLVDSVTSFYRVPGTSEDARIRQIDLDSAQSIEAGTIGQQLPVKVVKRVRSASLRYEWPFRAYWHTRRAMLGIRTRLSSISIPGKRRLEAAR